MPNPVKVLSLDGGGTKGVFHFFFLKELEARLSKGGPLKPLSSSFDYIGGTSIGAILSLGITHPLKILDYKEPHTMQDLYEKNVHMRLLDANFGLGKSFLPRCGILGPKYGDRTNIVDSFYGNELFGQDAYFGRDNYCNTIAFCYDTLNMRPKVFKSWRQNHQVYKLKDVSRASSAAPIYFQAVVLKNAETNEQEILIDGGVFANDPSIFLIQEIRVRAGDFDTPITMVSLGTSSPTKPLTYEDIGDAGLIGWSTKFIDLIFECQGRAYMYLNGHGSEPHSPPINGQVVNNTKEEIRDEDGNLVGICDYHEHDNIRYFRFVPLVSDELDSVDPAFIKRLERTALRFFDQNPFILQECIKTLAAS